MMIHKSKGGIGDSYDPMIQSMLFSYSSSCIFFPKKKKPSSEFFNEVISTFFPIFQKMENILQNRRISRFQSFSKKIFTSSIFMVLHIHRFQSFLKPIFTSSIFMVLHTHRFQSFLKPIFTSSIFRILYTHEFQSFSIKYSTESSFFLSHSP
jgi:hypothetical protein